MSAIQPVTTSFTAVKQLLVSDHFQVLPGGGTFANTGVVANGDGKKLILRGEPVGKITASGKYGLYNDAAVDGLEVCIGLAMQEIDVTDGDEMGSILLHGFVKEAALPTAINAAAKVDLKNAIFFV